MSLDQLAPIVVESLIPDPAESQSELLFYLVPPIYHSLTMNILKTQFAIGQVVRHRVYPFRGVIVDVDPEFNNSEEWWQAIPEEIRPRKDQPFYHLLAENGDTSYVAYVSEQNLLIDESGIPVNHPEVAQVFGQFLGNSYEIPASYRN